MDAIAATAPSALDLARPSFGLSDSLALQCATFRRLLRSTNDLPEGARERLWSNPDAWLAEGQTLKAGGRCTVARVDHGGRSWVLKRYNNNRGALHAWTHALLPSRAARGWSLARWMRRNQLEQTPRPVAVLEERLGWLRGRSYLLMELVAGESLHTYLGKCCDSRDRLAEVSTALGDLWATMGRLRLSHGDFKPSNVMVEPSRHGAPRLWLIDLDSAQRHWAGPILKQAREKDRTRLLSAVNRLPGVGIVLAAALAEQGGESRRPAAGKT